MKNLLTTARLFRTLATASLCLGATADAQTFTILKSFGVLSNVTGFRARGELVWGHGGTLYGTTSDGEGNVLGTVFKVQPDGSGFTVLKWFTNELEGYSPSGLISSGNVLYGTTATGGGLPGEPAYGTVFRINTDGTDYTVLKRFGADPGGPITFTNGAMPHASLALANGVLYGTTIQGGNQDYGTVFRLNVDGTGFAVLKHFTRSDGSDPEGPVTAVGNVLYGTTQYGGNFGAGTVFRLNLDGTDYQVLKHFTGDPMDGDNPNCRLIASGKYLFGTTLRVPRNGNSGTVFRMSMDGTEFTFLKYFSWPDGGDPYAGLVLQGHTLYGATQYGGNLGGGTVFKLDKDGDGFAVLMHFNAETSDPSTGRVTNSEPAFPRSGLILAGHALYGTTEGGGSADRGTVFKLNTDGTELAILKSFAYNSQDGFVPHGLTLSEGVLYGTATDGGPLSHGTLFKMSTNGAGFAVLKAFGAPGYSDPFRGTTINSDGLDPFGAVAVSDNTIYGTTYTGGASGYGTVFRVSNDGTGFTVLKNFTGSDGKFPLARLTLSGTTLYGTTPWGGSSDLGTVFKLNTDGSGFVVLKSFGGGYDGEKPYGGVTLSDNVIYSATSWTIFKMNTDGTGYRALRFEGSRGDLTLAGSTIYGTGGLYQGFVFKMNIDGIGFTVLKSFTGTELYADSGVSLSGNTLYGTTFVGGSIGVGTVFQVNTDGTGFMVLKNFGGNDGSYPTSGLAVSGATLYGSTSAGGSINEGAIFRIDLPGPSIGSN
jgi:hypothetical protein